MSLFFLCSCSDKQTEVHTWRLQTHAPQDSLDYEELQKFSAKIAKISGGRLMITPVPGGEITNGPDIYTAVKERRIEMGNGWPNWWSGQHPAWAVMNAGPFDFMNLDASMMFFISSDGTELANELAKEDGIIWRTAWWPGMEFGLIGREPITGLDDLKGKKIRIGPGLPSEVLAEASSAYTIPLVPQEILPAMEQGLIDAVEWTTSRGVVDLNLQQSGSNAIVPAVWQPSVVSDFLINQEAYSELPEDLQTLLETAIESFALTMTLKSKVADFEALAHLIDSGVQINQWTDDDIKRWRTANDKILQKYTQRDEYTGMLINRKQAFKKQYNEYYQYFKSYEQPTSP